MHFQDLCYQKMHFIHKTFLVSIPKLGVLGCDAQCCMCTKPTFLNFISEINIISLMSPLMNLVWTPHFFLALAIWFLGTPSGLPETTLGFTGLTQFEM